LRRKVFFSGLLLAAAGLGLYHLQLITYGVKQGIGQLNLVIKAKPVEEVIFHPNTPDSVKSKLQFLSKVREFAMQEIGLDDTKNYTTYYDQQGKEVLWVVTACEEFKLKEFTWSFPVVGSVPYKGFFNRAEAVEEAGELKSMGLDVSVRNPGGWSTLGWFRDPILSGMLERSDGQLASLIIHEMVHATIFVKDSVQFNENMASFIGDQGALMFMERFYGINSPQWMALKNEFEEEDRWNSHMLRGAKHLDSLYQSFQGRPNESIRAMKHEAIKNIFLQTDTLRLSNKYPRPEAWMKRLPDNTFFMNYIRYQAGQRDLKQIYDVDHRGNLKNFVDVFRQRFPYL